VTKPATSCIAITCDMVSVIGPDYETKTGMRLTNYYVTTYARRLTSNEK